VLQIEITKVASRADRDAFIKFPWRIYKNDPAWVPPLLLERKEFIDREKHPFFEHGQAEFFLARRGDEIVGRIAASDDPNYNALHHSNVGCFGMFESVDDQDVANALFEAAENWLRGKGRDEIMGPIDYSTNYVCGLLVDGFEHPPTVLTSHNPPSYAALFESRGFTKITDFYAWWFPDATMAIPRLRRLARKFARRNLTIRAGNLKNIHEEGRRLREIYNQAWANNWGFVPFSESEIEYMTKELKPIVDPEWTLFAEADGKPVGFILGVPDINVALQKIDGRLTHFGFPIGLIKLLYHKSKIRKARLIALGVIEQYRRAGVAEMLVLRVMEDGMQNRGFSFELSMTLEDNHLINRFLEAIGATKYKTYRIYRRGLNAIPAA
jgi:ribosomal protein S18 acetylase RimI-like enzyme